jgi:hypothetical protein
MQRYNACGACEWWCTVPAERGRVPQPLQLPHSRFCVGCPVVAGWLGAAELLQKAQLKDLDCDVLCLQVQRPPPLPTPCFGRNRPGLWSVANPLAPSALLAAPHTTRARARACVWCVCVCVCVCAGGGGLRAALQAVPVFPRHGQLVCAEAFQVPWVRSGVAAIKASL